MVPYIKRKIIKKKDAFFEEIDDFIAAEKRLRVFINRRDFMSLYCTPLMIKELVAGLLLTEGILANKISPDQIRIVDGNEIRVDLHVDEEILKESLVVSRCLGGITFHKEKKFKKIKDDFSLSVETLNLIFEEFQQKSELFRLTGCFHSAALSDDKKIIAFAEDIGRHNAVDKVIGYSIFRGIPFTGKLMVVSCRISSEIISKCARWQIPIIASRAAPTELAIDIAEKAGITLAGFVRGDHLNVYTNTQRITSVTSNCIIN
ncbi:MAG TPA: formate dehydrogenase accessory sulfurtransferase FdhD [Nitrospiraceae bacterium]|nr:formate dehydrogenase accessory sulfurtransferase FdhD [Nitrospiraceae bacterium]